MSRCKWFSNVAAVLVVTVVGASEPDSVGFEDVNAVFGLPIWVDDHLWDDPDHEVGERLGWPKESETSMASSFRRYPMRGDQVLGARPFSLAFYGADGTAEQLSMVFANKGDVLALIEIDPTLNEVLMKREAERQMRDYKKFIEADEKAITERLTELVGPPVPGRLGEGRTQERVTRWDWKGHSILLAAPSGEYVAVRVVPTEVADGEEVERVHRADLREMLTKRVERRENGDVVLTEIPMVDQGPKGYCVPATWERVLRYLGIPADMYVLAMAGSTNVGGGTSVQEMMAGVADVVRRNGRRLNMDGGRLNTRMVAKYIDNGFPMMWTMYVHPEVNQSITTRSKDRQQVGDWEVYLEGLGETRRAARRLQLDRESGHVCMIIGYNRETAEIAISDSWGPQYEERWITEEEAQAISQGRFVIVN